MKATFPLLLLPFLLSQQCLAAGKCVYPDGSDSKNDYPCDPNADVSICCGGRQGSSCLTNKLCEAGTGNRSRGSCTKKGDPKCADYCLATEDSGIKMISCTNTTKKETSYCCDLDPGCCDSDRVFDIFPANPKIYAVWDESRTRFVSVGASSTATSTSHAPTNTSSPGSGGGNGDGLSTGAKAGIGVGVAVMALLVVAVAYLFWKLHNKPKPGSVTPQVSQMSSPPNQLVYPPPTYNTGTPYPTQQPPFKEPQSHAVGGVRSQPPSELDAGPESERPRAELPAHN